MYMTSSYEQMFIDSSAQPKGLQCLFHPSRLHNFYLYFSLIEFLVKIIEEIFKLQGPLFGVCDKWEGGIDSIGKDDGQRSDVANRWNLDSPITEELDYGARYKRFG